MGRATVLEGCIERLEQYSCAQRAEEQDRAYCSHSWDETL